MSYDGGANGARARSARIRASHDDEATQLEAMHRRSVALAARPQRARLLTRLAAAFSRPSRPVVEVEDATAIAGASSAE